jgi:hypothetical protein
MQITSGLFSFYPFWQPIPMMLLRMLIAPWENISQFNQVYRWQDNAGSKDNGCGMDQETLS